MKVFKNRVNLVTNDGIPVSIVTIEVAERNWVIYRVSSADRVVVRSDELPSPEDWPNKDEVFELVELTKYAFEIDNEFHERPVYARESSDKDSYVIYSPHPTRAITKSEIDTGVTKHFEVYLSKPDMFHAKEMVLGAMTDRIAGIAR